MEYKIFGCKVNKYYLNKRLNYFSDNKKTDIFPLFEKEDNKE
jgi:hypothetical protein